MELLRFYFLIALTSLFTGCGSNQPADTQSNETADTSGTMAQFAEDEEFKAAHEEPAELTFEGRGEMIEFDTPDGRQGRAYALMPEGEIDTYLFVIHEWWGLNDHIKAEAERLYDKLDNVGVLALDLYDGKVANTADQASSYMQAFEQARGEAVVKGALAMAGPDASIGTIGWCFGGGWSLRASILAGPQGAGCVMYYGMPVQSAEALEPIECDVLGIFARQDDHINEEVVSKFEKLCEQTNTDLEVHWFDAAHAFANPSSPRYAEEAAQEANQLAWSFLEERL